MSEQEKRLFIKTYGCQMNVYDSERMEDAAQQAGYQITAAAADADLILLNTCHIRDKAAEKVYSDLGRYRKLKDSEELPVKMIGVAGCVAQAEGAEILRRARAVDFVVGPQNYQDLAGLIKDAEAGERRVATELATAEKFAKLPKASAGRVRRTGRAAFLTVQEGCDKFCTFCVVPYTRGAEFSRPAADLVREAEALAAEGVREITLLGQNVNAYAGQGAQGKVSLASLLYQLSEIKGIERLRYTTSHPRDMSNDLVEAHRDLGCLMPYLHLPVQSGSDKILKAMNRRHTAEEYLAAVDKVRQARPDLALSSDFIVGFPGESEADFQATLDIAREVGFASAYSFKYSPRPGTPAAENPDQIAEEVKAERLARLQAQLEADRRKFNGGCLGMTMPVLLERKGKHDGQLIGRSPYLQAVHVVMPSHRIGEIVPLKVVEVGALSLKCEAA